MIWRSSSLSLELPLASSSAHYKSSVSPPHSYQMPKLFAFAGDEGLFSSISAFSNSDVLKATQDKLDEKIQDANEYARRLKTRRNELVPIARLPSEILSMVFSMYAHASVQGIHGISSRAIALPWVVVTHVCHHFRSVALAYPSL